MIIAVDPGTETSGFVIYDEVNKIVGMAVAEMPNAEVLANLYQTTKVSEDAAPIVVCEWIESFGLAVGKEVFQTVRWIGRFEEAMLSKGRPFYTVTRKQVKINLCHSMLAKDKNIRRVLLDMFGGDKAVGTKKAPGPLYSVSSHSWSALAVAMTWLILRELEGGNGRPEKALESNPFSS